MVMPPPQTQNNCGYSFTVMDVSLPAAATPSPGAHTAESYAKPAEPESAPAASLPNYRLPDRVFRALMANTPDLPGGVGLLIDGTYTEMLVDSGASSNFVESELTPGLLASMRDYELLQVPHEIVAAGQHVLFGVAAGTINGTITDDGGNKRNFSLRAIIVPELETNLFSVSLAIVEGMAALFHQDKPRSEKGDLVVRMKTLGVDKTTGIIMCSIDVAVENRAGITVTPIGAAFKVASARLWHRRMGHANRNTMEVLWKIPHSGVEYNGNLKPCDVCPFGKSEQQP
ncbi:GAG-pre-integrase domain-containing protein, partial [Marinobacter alexandrii]|uniref:GAG-pre-integrase domain-containing protein n=1 Tax=Marinobacter alexandrii TaxID=2570351 RepID=UPI00329A53E5